MAFTQGNERPQGSTGGQAQAHLRQHQGSAAADGPAVMPTPTPGVHTLPCAPLLASLLQSLSSGFTVDAASRALSPQQAQALAELLQVRSPCPFPPPILSEIVS